MTKKRYVSTVDSRRKIALILSMMAIIAPMLVMGQLNAGLGNQTTKRYRIVVPVTPFEEFVKTSYNATTREHVVVGGFAVELFKAVAKANPALQPYQDNFDFISYSKPDGTMNGSYNDMLTAVFSKDYEGAAGDISILLDRMELVEFTLPFMDTGISMLVLLPQTQSRGIPLVRFAKGFAAATLAFGITVALVFWILEYRNDKHASLPQIVSSRAQPARNFDELQREMKEAIMKTRLIVMLLFMLLLVFIACYTASQGSLQITALRQKVPVKNLNQLRRKGDKIGYQEGSFVKDLLSDRGLDLQLVAFNKKQDMLDQLFNGSIAAIVGLTPKIKLLRALHCDSLAIVPSFNLPSAGYAFAFQRGSTFVRDFSNGILMAMNKGTLGRIQDSNMGSLDVCQDDGNRIGTNHQTVDSDTLWIIVAGGICVLLLTVIIFMVHWSIRCNTRKNKALAYPCYLLPCC